MITVLDSWIYYYYYYYYSVEYFLSKGAFESCQKGA